MRILLLSLFVFFFGQVRGQIVVCPDCEVSSIKQAVALAMDGDQILVESGTYKESNIEIDKPLHLVGRGRPVIDGEFKETIFRIRADGFSVMGLRVINVGQSYTKDFAAILVSRSSDFVIEDNEFENVFFGLLIEKSKQGRISNNQVVSHATSQASSGNGIHLWHCKDMSVNGNEVSGVRDGIYFEFVENSKVHDNLSHDNLRYGLHFMFSNNNAYYDNEFRRNGAGVAIMFSKFVEMYRNRFMHNWGSASYGLLLKEIYDADIKDNLFEKNTIAISVDGSTRINYYGNTFLRNGWAIKIIGACYDNSFTHNNFLNNALDLSYNSKVNTNKFDHNYWSEYAGYDLDRNGLGDVPYRPVKLFSYVVHNTPEAIILLRSMFVDIINFSEKVSPVFTPDQLKDNNPLMKRWYDTDQLP